MYMYFGVLYKRYFYDVILDKFDYVMTMSVLFLSEPVTGLMFVLYILTAVQDTSRIWLACSWAQ